MISLPQTIKQMMNSLSQKATQSALKLVETNLTQTIQKQQLTIDNLTNELKDLKNQLSDLKTNNVTTSSILNKIADENGMITNSANFGDTFVPAHWVIGNDSFGIHLGDTGSDKGYADLFTTDNGDEPIYVSQYIGGMCGNPIETVGDSKYLCHRITLMDVAGNQHLNSVYVSQIVFPDGTVMKTAR